VPALGLLISVPMALARLSRWKALAWPAAAYVIFFRGTPAMILLFFVYFGSGRSSARMTGCSVRCSPTPTCAR